MNERRYYSQRQGFIKPLVLKDLKLAFQSVYNDFKKRYYFIEFLGTRSYRYDGIIGNSFEAFCMRKINRNIKHPDLAMTYEEEDLFNVIELLHEYITYPFVNKNEDYFSISEEASPIPEKKEIAQKEFREEINIFLKQYSSGWELSNDGYIRNTLEESFVNLVDNTEIYGDESNVDLKIRRAKELYLKHGSNKEDKKAAVREIGDALEFIRTDLKEKVGKNEIDLFNILNNFGIRHNNVSQKNDYDYDIYLPWMFYIFLSTYDAYVKLRNRE
ncbi:hypothetical protein MKY98_05875 [Paenibacillus sp. FSL M8-0228]|jgi:hypothetical protein|uniref:hypothetical protein n=1 Tax=Paenibacillus TaxID=44249 RepID=UPI00083D1CCC|nr:hypothetical protein [Paenibacillus polymyxa]MBO3283524.1 hypothetical protein [Paenibacillus polymyxa]ODB58663.1 hypothetical protein A7311_13135 [Paenibacillus polymyxa]